MTNLVILVGRIARDPETRTTTGGASITSISVVTDCPACKDGKTYVNRRSNGTHYWRAKGDHLAPWR